MNLNCKENLILQMLDTHPDLGKTAVMKIVFMLQQVKNIDLGYNYSIYTYGPYSSEVMEDIETLIAEGMIISKTYPYQNYIGYQLSISPLASQSISELGERESNALNEILKFVHGKSAKDLELYSTIIFINGMYQKNSLKNNVSDIVKQVKEIKPHFDESVIVEAYNLLDKIDFLAA